MEDRSFDWIMVAVVTVLTLSVMIMVGTIVYGVIQAFHGQQVCQIEGM